MEKDKTALTKKIIKIIGNIVAVISVVFIVKKFLELDINIKDFSSPKIIAAILILVLFQLVCIFTGSYPWIKFVTFFSGKEIKMSDAIPVYTKSNILKYLPGNIFQFVGRNQLAIDLSISHKDVACATIVDILFSIVILTLFGVSFVGRYLSELIKQYNISSTVLLLAAIAVALLILICIAAFFNQKVKGLIKKYIGLFTKENVKNLFKGAAYYLLFDIIASVIYLICVYLVFGSLSYSEAFQLVGAYMISWVIGYITPGAPGGIGIRESVMLLVCGGAYETGVMLYVILFRISSIISDFLGFVLGLIYERGLKGEKKYE